MSKLLKIILVIFILPILLLIFLLCVKLAGYNINKNFFVTKESCIASVESTKLADRIFWKRWNFTMNANKNEWLKSYVYDAEYCDNLERKNKTSGALMILLDSSIAGERCSSDDFLKMKMHESAIWNFMVSEEKDKYYYEATNEFCPTQYLLK